MTATFPLARLRPRLRRLTHIGADGSWIARRTDAVAGAHGLLHLCPLCWLRNGGPRGTHAMLCWTPEVPQTIPPLGGRWPMTGTGVADITLTGSVLISCLPCQAHYFIARGQVRLV